MREDVHNVSERRKRCEAISENAPSVVQPSDRRAGSSSWSLLPSDSLTFGRGRYG